MRDTTEPAHFGQILCCKVGLGTSSTPRFIRVLQYGLLVHSYHGFVHRNALDFLFYQTLGSSEVNSP